MLKRLAYGLCLGLISGTLSAAEVIETTSIAGFGTPKYSNNFSHFDYVNPDAPKGGRVSFAVLGTYDNFNRFASRGDAAVGTAGLYDSLMTSSSDEVDSYYPLVGRNFRYASDYSWMEVEFHPAARFHDGERIKPSDMEFTFTKFMTEGVPFVKDYYKEVKSVKAIDDRKVRIEMDPPSKDKLFAMMTLPILPEHYWNDKNFSEPSDAPPLGSSAYKITDYKMGQSITYTRVKDYWAKDLPVNVGRNNFDVEHYDYYRDETVMVEAFKAGEYDLREENSSKRWATAYNGVNFDKGFIHREEIAHEKPQTMQGFVFNTQRPVFSDPRVREALGYAFDFEWTNKNLFFSQYSRTRSYFQNTDYEAVELPDKAELKVLEPIKDKVPSRVFTEVYQPNITDGSGRIRGEMRKAFGLLKQAGWELNNKVMTNRETGEPLTFELLIYSPSTERYAIPLQDNLKSMGVEMKIRTIDTTQYLKRMRDRDFDMISRVYAANPFPSSGLLLRWNSKYIDSTYNSAGVMDEAVDYLTDQIEASQDEPEKLLSLGRALDRVLQWNFYAIPQWHSSSYRVAYWDKFARPEIMPKYTLGLDTWWLDTNKAAKLPEKRR
ncbi:extracellular solute-binding protein [Parasalinivibrio latis]|uniref:extracellular solute-binding protein n=1 Tax=Parasalinivibrio latis TaxID=2952610 RepID=UPI0030DF7F7A